MSFNNHDNGYPNINNYFNDPNIQTNMWTAQNLQDALNRYAPPNSKGLYHYMQDGEEYECEIYTSHNGNKSYKVYKRVLCNDTPAYGPKEIAQLFDKIKQLEDRLNAKSANVTTNGSTTMS